MAGELHRDIDNAVDTVPEGIAGTGTLTVNAVVNTVFNGTGTALDEQIGVEPNPWLFFPGVTPPQLLEVESFNGPEWIKTKTAPSVAIAGQAFKIVFAKLKKWGLYNKGATSAYLNGDSSNGIEIETGQTEDCPPTLHAGNSGYDFKDVIFVDATGTIVEVFEQN